MWKNDRLNQLSCELVPWLQDCALVQYLVWIILSVGHLYVDLVVRES